MNESKTCPDCLSEIPATAAFCRHCGQRVEGKDCPDCGSRCPEAARRCRCCGFFFEPEHPTVDLKPFTLHASLLGTLFLRGRLLPRSIRVDSERIVIITPGYFNLTRREEDIPWGKIAGYDYHSGILWDTVRLETRGQFASAFRGLSKRNGKKLREVLQRVTHSG